MKVKLLDITQDPLNKIGEYAAICYNSKNEPAANIRRALHCKESGHLATMRFATATFHISGISRVCSHQLVRHKFLDYLQRSQRYCKETAPLFVIPYDIAADKELREMFIKHVMESHRLYHQLLSCGIKKEDARFVLPECTSTELVVTGSLQAWLDFIQLRADKHAQWEIRQVAVEINNILAKHCEGLFNALP